MGLIIRKPKRQEAKKMFEELKNGKKLDLAIDPDLLRKRRKIEDLNRKKRKFPLKSYFDDDVLKGSELNANLLTMRIKDIWDVNIKDIWPEIQTKHNLKKGVGQYFPKTHTMAFGSNASVATTHHEVVHGVDQLLSPTNNNLMKVVSCFDSSGLLEHMKSEAIANLTNYDDLRNDSIDSTSSARMFSGLVYAFHLGLIYLDPLFILFAGKSAGRQIELSLIRNRIYKLFEEHGTDGLILYMVFPPRVIGTLETIIWKRKMVKLGLLRPNGGLTDLGITFVKKVLSKKEILKRLNEMKRNRVTDILK